MVCGCMGVAGAHASASGITLQTSQHMQPKLRQLHFAVCHGKAHIAHSLVLTPHCRCSSRSRPFTVLLLQLLLLLAASPDAAACRGVLAAA